MFCLKVNVALPSALVCTMVWPMYLLPSPKPILSAAGVLKNWIVKFLSGVELMRPFMVVEELEVLAERSSG